MTPRTLATRGPLPEPGRAGRALDGLRADVHRRPTSSPHRPLTALSPLPPGTPPSPSARRRARPSSSAAAPTPRATGRSPTTSTGAKPCPRRPRCRSTSGSTATTRSAAAKSFTQAACRGATTRTTAGAPRLSTASRRRRNPRRARRLATRGATAGLCRPTARLAMGGEAIFMRASVHFIISKVYRTTKDNYRAVHK
jgi:hypothetical protein